MIAAAAILGCAAVAWLAHRRWLVVTVRGGSMAPTLRDGQQLLVRRGRGYQRGDLVVFLPPPSGDAGGDATGDAGSATTGEAGRAATGEPPYRIKRVAAVSGDAVPPWLPAAGYQRVPAHHLVVSGDHAVSEDSRHFGFVSDDAVLGYVSAAAAPVARSGAPAPPFADDSRP